MRPKFKQSCLFSLLCCLVVTFCFFSPVLAKDETDVTVAVKRARDAGIPENMISQMLALGYNYNLKATEMANFLNIAREASEENLPIAPLVSKIEEGLAKRIRAGIIERVLGQQLSQYRFARRTAYKTMNRWGLPEQSLESGELVRLSKTLSMGISRQEMEGFFSRAPQAPITEIINALEILAALKQAHLQMKISEEIAFNGLKKGFFSKTAWNLPLMVNAAKSKKVADKKIKAAAIEVVSGKKSVLRAHTELGLDPKDLARGPQFSHPSVSKGKGTESGASDSGGMGGDAGDSGGMGGGGGGSGGSGGGCGGGGGGH
jgi:uncharacterized membrane protein YgcG